MLAVQASKIINAPIETVYNILADYETGHRAILPQPQFKQMDILKGGYGAGTEIRLIVEVYGQQTEYHQVVSEPVPGRVIREQDQLTAQFSEFRLEPISKTQTQVTIYSEMPVSSGIKGMVERWFQPGIVRRLFHQELANLAGYI